MSGIYSQLGFAKEVRASVPVTSAGVGTAGVPNTVLYTSTAHGLRAGDVITLSGYTPSGHNQTTTVVTVPTANTFTVQTGTTLLGNVTVHGTIAATAYGVATTPTRFFEFDSESLEADIAHIESKAIKYNSRVTRAARITNYVNGVNGDVTFEVLSKSFGYFLQAMFGAVATTGPTDSAYTHTATLADPRGQSFTIQKLVSPTQGGGFPFTYAGCKVTSWEISNDVGGILMLKLSFLGRTQDVTVPLAVASYPSGTVELLTFAGGQILMDGVALANVSKISITCDLKLSGDRRGIGPTTLRSEPLVAGIADIKATCSSEFNDMTAYNKYTAATSAGSLASLVSSWTAPTLIGATTYPKLTVTMPQARVDGATPKISGPDLLTVDIPFQALDSATGNDAISAVYISGDVTP